MGNTKSLQEHIFEIKLQSKQLQRASAKCEKLERTEREKLKKAMEKGDLDTARLHAENAIRQHNQANNFLRLSARMDGVVSRLNAQQAQQNIAKNMAAVTQSMGMAVTNMNLEAQFTVMEKFDKQCEELDIQLNMIDGTVQKATHALTPEGDVQQLMKQIADENGLEVASQLVDAPTKKVGAAEPVVTAAAPAKVATATAINVKHAN